MGGNGDSGPCCETGYTATINNGPTICVPDENYTVVMQNGSKYLVCVGGTIERPTEPTNGDYPYGTNIVCTGRFVIVENNRYSVPISATTINANTPRHVYYDTGDNTHSAPQNQNGNGDYFIHYGN